jgi:hypothetical protein
MVCALNTRIRVRALVRTGQGAPVSHAATESHGATDQPLGTLETVATSPWSPH